MYSNSRRSTAPGRSGRPGAQRSRAWMPVISSIDTGTHPGQHGGRGGVVDLTDLGTLGLERRIGRRGQPSPHAVGLKVSLLFKKRPTELWEMVSTRPRFIASRASALWLQWVIGTPLASGASQARARMAQICGPSAFSMHTLCECESMTTYRGVPT